MTFKDAFPEWMVNASAKRQLSVGAVVKFRATLDDGREKEKRFVVVHVDEETLCCVMNSEIHPLIARNAAVLKCQVAVSGSEAYADKDCHFDCSRIRTFKTADVLAELREDPGRVLGHIDQPMREQIRSAIMHAPNVTGPEKAICSTSLA